MKTTRARDNIGGGSHGRSSRVLLVIEEAEYLNHHGEFLRAQGHEVFLCKSYERGLNLLGREAFDFVAVSQGGVTFEGRKVVMRAIETDRNTPVVVLTAVPDMENYLEAMQLGAVDYLEMAVPPAELARVLKTHLRHQSAA
jgi:DNA-binding response OmpR family regulator